jgi:hypothetical protein
MNETRPISVIAAEISKDWKNVNFAAKPYLDAMFQLQKVTDNYICDSGTSILSYFLCNATHWTGSVAKRVKTELRRMLKQPRRSRDA